MGLKQIISLKNIHFNEYNNQILSGITFDAYEHQVVALAGINGAGKSTTLKVCSGILMPSEGDISSQIHNPAMQIGFLPDNPPLLDNWSVINYLRYAAKIHEVKNINQAISRITELCKLENLLNKTIKYLSKGNKQRIGLAQAIIHQPKLVILDEPTSTLDPEQIYKFRKVINEVKKESCIIFSSHNINEISTLSDQVVIIHSGKTIKHIDNPSKKNIYAFNFSNQVDEKIFLSIFSWAYKKDNTHYFYIKNQEEKQSIIKLCLSKNIGIESITKESNLLEDIFISTVRQYEKHNI